MTSEMKDTAVLRFITAGSVDDGKSTLIGRLLYDSRVLLSDQIKAIQNKHNSDEINFAALTDGLSAEKEQGITIDVAYRYFSTVKRKFIIADTPGHEEYTRNMVTAASTADAAIILLDITRLDFSLPSLELLLQTKRHSALLKLLCCRHIIIAVNKLDLIDFSEEKYLKVVNAYQKLAEQLKLNQLIFIPISALHGDNIVEKSTRTSWFTGKTLLQTLEELPLEQQKHLEERHSYFPVQFVLRQDGSTIDDFRGYQGRLEQGKLVVGQEIKIAGSQKTSSIKDIIGTQGIQQQAVAGEVLTITLNDDIDISRGDVIINANNPINTTNSFSASICWFDEQDLNPSSKYLLKQTTKTVAAKISPPDFVWDVHTLSTTKNNTTLKMNDIGLIHVKLQQKIAIERYQDHHNIGSFILINEATNNTVAAGMIVSEDRIENWEI